MKPGLSSLAFIYILYITTIHSQVTTNDSLFLPFSDVFSWSEKQFQSPFFEVLQKANESKINKIFWFYKNLFLSMLLLNMACTLRRCLPAILSINSLLCIDLHCSWLSKARSSEHCKCVSLNPSANALNEVQKYILKLFFR